MIDLNKKLSDKELLKSLKAFCNNYIHRTNYLERENLIRDDARKGIEKNFRNAHKLIDILEEKINE